MDRPRGGWPSAAALPIFEAGLWQGLWETGAVVSRRNFLAAAGAAAALTAGGKALGACGGADGLRAVACAGGRRFGAAASTPVLGREPALADLYARECSALTPEWELKWAQIQKTPGQFHFAAIDRLAAFARRHDMILRGHTLLWHLDMPDWLIADLGRDTWARLIERHIHAVCGRYRQDFFCWDVVNEAVQTEDGRSDGLRDSPWLRAAGPAYVETAFLLAAEAAPGVRLVYNDFGLAGSSQWVRGRQTAVLRLLERLRGRDVPVHALGMQAHLRVGDEYDQRVMADFLREVEAMGVRPVISELDVTTDRVEGAAAKDAAAARLARHVLDVVLGETACDTVVTWGLADPQSWIRRRRPEARPLPFDDNLRPKPLYEAIRAALAAAPPLPA